MQRYTGVLLWAKSLTVYTVYKVLYMATVQDMMSRRHRVPGKQRRRYYRNVRRYLVNISLNFILLYYKNCLMVL